MKKVLIVDDNPAIQEIVSELVSSAGYIPITATGGKDCLDKVASEQPDLVLLDINMPDMDGWTVLRKLKEVGATEKLKVMMLTATTEIGTDIFGLQDVVSGYIRKPFNNLELTERSEGGIGDSLPDRHRAGSEEAERTVQDVLQDGPHSLAAGRNGEGQAVRQAV